MGMNIGVIKNVKKYKWWDNCEITWLWSTAQDAMQMLYCRKNTYQV